MTKKLKRLKLKQAKGTEIIFVLTLERGRAGGTAVVIEFRNF